MRRGSSVSSASPDSSIPHDIAPRSDESESVESLLVTAIIITMSCMALYVGVWRRRSKKAPATYAKLCTVLTPESLVRLMKLFVELKVDYYVDVAKTSSGRSLVQIEGEDAATDVFVSEKDLSRSKALLTRLRSEGFDG